MIKIYGSKFCPNCEHAKKNFDYYNIPYEYIDINESLKNLKAFLYIRDHNKLYDSVKENNLIGIPTIVVDDNAPTFDWCTILHEAGATVILEPDDTEIKKVCSLKDKNC